MRQLAIAITLAACGSHPPPAPVVQAPAGAPHATLALDRHGTAGPEPVANGAHVRDGDLLEVWVTVDRPAYVYLVEFYADGQYDLLFPSDGAAVQVQPGVRLRIPARPTAWLQVSGTAGEEHVHALVTTAPLATVSPSLATALGIAVDARAQAVTPPPVVAAVAPDPTPIAPIDAGAAATPKVVAVAPPAPSVRHRVTPRAAALGAHTQPSVEVAFDERSKDLKEVVIDDHAVSLHGDSGITALTVWFSHGP